VTEVELEATVNILAADGPASLAALSFRSLTEWQLALPLLPPTAAAACTHTGMISTDDVFTDKDDDVTADSQSDDLFSTTSLDFFTAPRFSSSQSSAPMPFRFRPSFTFTAIFRIALPAPKQIKRENLINEANQANPLPDSIHHRHLPPECWQINKKKARHQIQKKTTKMTRTTQGQKEDYINISTGSGQCQHGENKKEKRQKGR
jgi:hypothetical protein